VLFSVLYHGFLVAFCLRFLLDPPAVWNERGTWVTVLLLFWVGGAVINGCVLRAFARWSLRLTRSKLELEEGLAWPPRRILALGFGSRARIHFVGGRARGFDMLGRRRHYTHCNLEILGRDRRLTVRGGPFVDTDLAWLEPALNAFLSHGEPEATASPSRTDDVLALRDRPDEELTIRLRGHRFTTPERLLALALPLLVLGWLTFVWRTGMPVHPLLVWAGLGLTALILLAAAGSASFTYRIRVTNELVAIQPCLGPVPLRLGRQIRRSHIVSVTVAPFDDPQEPPPPGIEGRGLRVRHLGCVVAGSVQRIDLTPEHGLDTARFVENLVRRRLANGEMPALGMSRSGATEAGREGARR
jgi:hypothetical protein